MARREEVVQALLAQRDFEEYTIQCVCQTASSFPNYKITTLFMQLCPEKSEGLHYLLGTAVYQGWEDVVKYLAEQKQVDIKGTVFEQCSFYHAVDKKNLSMLKLLLEHPTLNEDDRIHYGSYSVHQALETGAFDFALKILKTLKIEAIETKYYRLIMEYALDSENQDLVECVRSLPCNSTCYHDFINDS
jgi:hypothetical protein